MSDKITVIEVFIEDGRMKVLLGKGNPAILTLALMHAELCIKDVLTQRTLETAIKEDSGIVMPQSLTERLG